jgi:signal transduction histidine kinase
VIATLFFLFIGFTVLGQTLYYYRYYFYPLISINAVITYYHLIKSIQKKYSPSWFFLAATIPIIFISTIDITSDFNNFPIQTLHDYYYAATFIEMFCLAIGIIYRFRIERSSLQSLQRELFVAEIKAQDRERERIARDLHDRIGNTIFRVRVSLQDFSDLFLKMKEPKKMYDKNISDLVKVYGEVQGLSRQLMPQNLVESDLLEEIRLQYGYTKNPNFKLSLPEKPLNLGVYFERTVYKIISEAVLNILKHAKATEVGIEISKDDKIFRLRIEDNGIGFDLNHLKKDGIGLNNLRFRAETELNGKISIESSPGNGTIILLKIKLKDIPTPRN